VLCELLVGSPPSSGTGTDLLRRRASEPVAAPSSIDPSIPEELDQVVLRACALDPADRYATASDMAAELREATGASTYDAPPVDLLLDHVTGEIRLPDMEPTTFVSDRTRKRRLRKRGRLRKIAITVAVLAVLLAGGRAAAWLFAPQMVPVPDVVGLSRTEAVATAERLGLTIEVVDRKRTMEFPRNHVIEQDPATGELQEGSVVSVVVSAGRPRSRIPDLTGMTERKATAKLEDLNMRVGKIAREYSAEREGTVIAQSFVDGLLPWGSAVDLVVSRGPEPVAVPDVTGRGKIRARELLTAAGFEPIFVDAYSDDIAPGHVISTDPVGGQVVDAGSEVRVFISIGPEFQEIVMPDVRNMQVDAARARLEALGLRVRVVRSCPTGTTVVETHPIAGTKVHENDRVALFIC
ncbi:MAG: PASTA domain-containing protein, partial [Actinomycetota bacterium]|nr:PASTA domain-containing protein [Actinomycetota bacterium]